MSGKISDVRRRRFLTSVLGVSGGTLLAAGAAHLIPGGVQAAESALDLAAAKRKRRKRQRATFVIPSPDTIADVESALRDALEKRSAGSFEEAKDQLKQYRRRLEPSLVRPDSFLSVKPEFFDSPDGEALLASLDRFPSLIENTIVTQDDQDSIVLLALSACDKALVRGLIGITVGALFGGPAGALAGFIVSVGDLVLEC